MSDNRQCDAGEKSLIRSWGTSGVRAGVAVALVGVAVAGCGSGGDGGPTISQSTATTLSGQKEPLWNPCTQLPDNVLQGTRVDPASKKVSADSGQPVEAFTKDCFWRSTEGPYSVGVATYRATLDEIKTNNKFRDFRDVQIGSRKGLRHLDTLDAGGSQRNCYVTLPFAQGAVQVYVYWTYGEESKATQLPPCDIAIAHATNLEPSLPK
ncbi:DUF3558 domain-containing protein [Nocardia sp. CDC159]|uniref:DUF3558 domain-containing protein n=1 Tax=Nocardia pulmonis TaxID=2951408 RepID=A0A9X2EBE7_9NOCA|nr:MULTISPECIES: DUF3558 domain-containing protein [Nocardia]MCM6775291.1 DUF3558 domain-containing protein [Nocardia pulmonis]MCM6787975.1 DUF3558 domain-containing protein [Nocardia sp. CDC159]